MGWGGEGHHVGQHPSQQTIQHRSSLPHAELLPRGVSAAAASDEGPSSSSDWVSPEEPTQEVREEGGVRGQRQLRIDESVEEVEGGCGGVSGAGQGGREVCGRALQQGETAQRLLADWLVGTGERNEERWHH